MSVSGIQGIDVAAARARGIALANGADTNADSVADQAMALLLAAWPKGLAWRLSVVVANPRLFAVRCHTPARMRLANALARFAELARP